MDSLPPRSRLGTYPPPIAQIAERNEPGETAPEGPSLDLSVRLDRPFHELKEYLLGEFERAYLTRCLAESEMNVSLASRNSGLSRKHLRTLMAKYGIRRSSVVDSEPEAYGEPD